MDQDRHRGSALRGGSHLRPNTGLAQVSKVSNPAVIDVTRARVTLPLTLLS